MFFCFYTSMVSFGAVALAKLEETKVMEAPTRSRFKVLVLGALWISSGKEFRLLLFCFRCSVFKAAYQILTFSASTPPFCLTIARPLINLIKYSLIVCIFFCDCQPHLLRVLLLVYFNCHHPRPHALFCLQGSGHFKFLGFETLKFY